MSKNKSKAESITAVLVFLFLFTGITKCMGHRAFEVTLRHSPLLGWASRFIAIALPYFEILLAVILIGPRTRIWGLYVAGSLLSVFAIYLLYMVIFTPKLPCSCGGIISQLSWQQHILLNIFLAALSFIAIKLQKSASEIQSE